MISLGLLKAYPFWVWNVWKQQRKLSPPEQRGRHYLSLTYGICCNHMLCFLSYSLCLLFYSNPWTSPLWICLRQLFFVSTLGDRRYKHRRYKHSFISGDWPLQGKLVLHSGIYSVISGNEATSLLKTEILYLDKVHFLQVIYQRVGLESLRVFLLNFLKSILMDQEKIGKFSHKWLEKKSFVKFLIKGKVMVLFREIHY